MYRLSRCRTAALALGTIAVVAGIGACTSGGPSASSGGGGGGVQAAEPAPVDRSAAAGAGKAPSLGSAQGAGDLAVSSAKIRTAELTVTVRRGVSLPGRANAAEAIAAGSGGDTDADDRTSGKYGSAVLVLRVPPDRLIVVLDQLAKLGIERSRHVSTVDVTSKVADVNSRVTSARAAIVRLRELFQHTTKVADVIEVESELSSRESNLESVEAQHRALAAQTSTATITLTLDQQATPPSKPAATHHRSGFIGGLQNGWGAFSRATAALATAAGAVLPFALVGFFLVVIARLVWPRLRPQRPGVATPEELP